MSLKKKQNQKSADQIYKLLNKGEINEVWGKNKLKNLFASVDISSIVFFRILFGSLMLIDVINYFDKIDLYWILPKNHFYYWPFDFITPLSENGMQIIFILMGICSIFIIFGLFYRVSMTLFFLFFTYTFLLEQTRYLNHFYLIILVSFVMIFIPANTSASIDKKIFKKVGSETCHAWCLWLLRFMIALPYFFGGIAKLNSDWLHGEPLRMWLMNNANVSQFGNLFNHEGMVLFMVYSGLILDLFIVPALLFKKTRSIAFITITVFHVINSQLFRIDIFPWFMIASTTLFFNPDWFRRFINFFSKNKSAWPVVIPSKEKIAVSPEILPKQKKLLLLLSVWITIQLFLPIRHFFIPGNVMWTEEGQKFSWQMKLRAKKEIGSYKVRDKNSGKIYDINVSDYVKRWQREIMEENPNLVWQFSQIVKKDFKEKGMDISFFANVKASLNGRKYQQLIDSTVDLTSVKYEVFNHNQWIIPLTTPLNDRLNETLNNGNRINTE